MGEPVFAVGALLALTFWGFLRWRQINHQSTDAWQGHEKHPTDADGNYVPARDDKLRMGRLFLVGDRYIGWYRVGDTIKDWRGNRRQVLQVDHMACCYLLVSDNPTYPEPEPIAFEDVLRINGYPARFNG